MKFKDCYTQIVQERELFKNVCKKSQEIVSKLETELKSLETINSRTKVEIDGVTFTFYKKGIRSDKPLGQYYGNNNIRVYVANLYGDSDNFNFLKNGIPLKMKSIIMHELSHREEDENSVLQQNINSDYDEDSGYMNSPTEINARIIEKLNFNLTPYIKQLAKKGEYQHAFKLLMKRLNVSNQLDGLTADNRQKFIKNLYTTFLGVIDDEDF